MSNYKEAAKSYDRYPVFTSKVLQSAATETKISDFGNVHHLHKMQYFRN